MGKKNNIIEINGKRYDARTGATLSVHTAKTAAPHRAVDGIIRPAAHAAPSKPAATRKVQITDGSAIKKASKPTAPTTRRQAAKTAGSHTPQPARTLMRHAVKKPAPGLKRRVKAQNNTDELLKQPKHTLLVKKSVHRLDNKRLQTAHRVSKSRLISRFAKMGQPSVPIIAPEPIVSQPEPIVPRIAAARKPVTLKRPKTTADLLEHALQQATSHQQPPHSIKKKRRFSFV